MKKYINLLALIIFIVSIWTINTLFNGFLQSNLSELKDLKKEFYLKQSFSSQDSLMSLSKSIDEFVPTQLNKVEIFNLINKLAQESAIEIKNLDLKESKIQKESKVDELSKDNNINVIDKDIKFNTLNVADINIVFDGNKQSVDLFLSKLVESNLYIEIFNVNLDFNSKSNDLIRNVSGSILVKVYYINL